MARISAGEDFGQAVAQPMRLNETVLPKPISGAGLSRIGDVLSKQAADEMAEAKHQRDQADKAIAGAQLGVVSDQLNDLVNEFDEDIKTGRVPKTEAAKRWEERSNEVLTAGLESIPEAHRGIAQIGLKGQAQRLSSKIGASVLSKDKDDTLAGMKGILELAQRLSITDPEAGGKMADDAIDNLGPNTKLSATQLGELRQGFKEGTAYTRATAQLLDARGDNKALAALEKEIAANSILDPQRKTELVGRVRTQIAQNNDAALRSAQRAALEQARRNAQAEQAVKALQAIADSGQMVDRLQADEAVRLTAGTPWAGVPEKLVQQASERTGFIAQPLAVQREAQALLLQKGNTPGQGWTDADRKEYDKRQGILKKQEDAYATNPLRAGADYGVIDAVAPVDLSSAAAFAKTAGPRILQAQTISAHTGKPASFLEPQEAAAVGRVLSAMPDSAKGEYIAAMSRLAGPGMMAQLAKQIDPDNRALGLAMQAGAARTTDNRYVMESIFRGARALKEKTVKEDTTATGSAVKKINEVVGESIGGKWREDVVDAARFIYHGHLAEGRSTSYAAAVRLAMGGDMKEHNGKTVPVPVGVDITRALAALPPAQVEAQAPDNVVHIPGVGTMSVLDFVARLPSAQLEPVAPVGTYGVRVKGGIVFNSNGDPIVIKVN